MFSIWEMGRKARSLTTRWPTISGTDRMCSCAEAGKRTGGAVVRCRVVVSDSDSAHFVLVGDEVGVEGGLKCRDLLLQQLDLSCMADGLKAIAEKISADELQLRKSLLIEFIGGALRS